MVCLKSVENVITLGKLIGLLFLFCLPLLSILFLINYEEGPLSPCNGNHFLVHNIFSIGSNRGCLTRFARSPINIVFIFGERSEPLTRCSMINRAIYIIVAAVTAMD